jgi:hypothetical protein
MRRTATRPAIAPRLTGLVLVGLALTVPQAGFGLREGGSARHSTSISISSSVPAFHGRVKSGSHACEKGRRVLLFRKRPGKDPKLLGSDRSGASGRWEERVGNNLQSGAYYAKVKPANRCFGARSTTAVIG